MTKLSLHEDLPHGSKEGVRRVVVFDLAEEALVHSNELLLAGFKCFDLLHCFHEFGPSLHEVLLSIQHVYYFPDVIVVSFIVELLFLELILGVFLGVEDLVNAEAFWI